MLTGRVRVVRIQDEGEARELIRRVGPDVAGLGIMAPKAVHLVLYVKDVSTPGALILKQEMLARGGEAAVNREVIVAQTDKTDMVLMGTLQQYRQALIRMRQQPFGLKALAEEIEFILDLNSIAKGDDQSRTGSRKLRSRGLACRDRWLPLGERTLMMGILNLTPDSFSDGGKYCEPAAALARAQQLVEEGADLLDVGAESTRPGFRPISAAAEWERLKTVLPLLIKELPIPISLDTYKAEVARRALDLGVHLINDIWGLQGDPAMAEVIAEYQVPVVVMHNRKKAEYRDLMAELVQDLGQSLRIADQAGIDPAKIILDPGIGFGKTLEHNLEVMKRLPELRNLGKPLLLGTSRKSMIGQVLDAPVDQRDMGTAATVVLGIAAGVDIVRVHDVRQIKPALRMADAIVR
ncbi:MAG: dihydropteroate synthase [Bacillota bacterium]|jgi:dihydropteroate synthase